MSLSLPPQCQVGKIIPKNTFFKQAKVTTKVKQEFTDTIQKIIWSYKLAPSTLSIPATSAVEEIQIFTLELKERTIPKQAIKVIIKSIPYPILFVCTYGKQEAYAIAVSALGETHYYYTDWNDEPSFSFTNTTLEAVYHGLVANFIASPGERVGDITALIATDKTRAKLEREIAALKNKIKNERQFNIKVELNQRLLAKHLELERNRKNN